MTARAAAAREATDRPRDAGRLFVYMDSLATSMDNPSFNEQACTVTPPATGARGGAA